MKLEVLVPFTWNGHPVDVGEIVPVDDADRVAVDCAATVVNMRWGRVVDEAPAKKSKRPPADPPPAADDNPPASRK